MRTWRCHVQRHRRNQSRYKSLSFRTGRFADRGRRSGPWRGAEIASGGLLEVETVAGLRLIFLKPLENRLLLVLPCGTLYLVAIWNIKHSGLRRFFGRGDASKVHAAHVRRLRHILEALDTPQPLRTLGGRPGYRLNRLSGNRAGFWAVRVSENWRVVFRIEGEHVFDVDLMDYH